jgi:hypothetical protein
MKKLRIAIVIMALANLVVAACHIGKHHTTIVENSNNSYLKIEYAGMVYFNGDGTAIQDISPGGYVKYHYNDKKLEAKNNGHGGVKYELFDGDHQLNLDSNGKRFIADAVKMMMKKGHNPNWKQL